MSPTHQPEAPRSSGLLPRATPSLTPGLPAGPTVAVGIEDNGRTVIVAVGEDLVVTVPNPSERELGDEMVRSSVQSVLRLLSADESLGSSRAVLRVPFRALRVGSVVITATGSVHLAVQVKVEAA